MRVLIRFISREAGGATETRERIFEGDALTLGRATDQVLHLKDPRVALEHARIARAGARIVLTCRPPAQVAVNGALTRDAALVPGDQVQIGANLLRILPPAPNCDFAFSFELVPEADSRETRHEAPRLSLGEVAFSRRRWAWIGFLALLAFGLVLPSSAPWGPTDRVWLPGPLHRAHATLGEECAACHARPFERVQSEACLTCHGPTLHGHVAGGAVTAAVEPERCTACHAEHDEPARLVQTDGRLCADCHRDLAAVAPQSRVAPEVTDFGTAHPEFATALLAAESTALKFPHDVHVAKEGIAGPEGDIVLTCADCHVPEPGGAGFRSVRMEPHCATCHRLDFDPLAPDATVPHGDPAAVERALVEHYSARYLAGYPDAVAGSAPARASALPSLALPRAERERLLGVARTRAALVARDVFERRVCVDCHAVEAGWHIEPVEIPATWMPAARFDHSKHGTELTPCSTCHAAEASTRAIDVLMPRIDTCRDCHGGTTEAHDSRLASDCTMCHAFHDPRAPLWGAPP